jgi:hypothetical protein
MYKKIINIPIMEFNYENPANIKALSESWKKF